MKNEIRMEQKMTGEEEERAKEDDERRARNRKNKEIFDERR